MVSGLIFDLQRDISKLVAKWRCKMKIFALTQKLKVRQLSIEAIARNEFHCLGLRFKKLRFRIAAPPINQHSLSASPMSAPAIMATIPYDTASSATPTGTTAGAAGTTWCTAVSPRHGRWTARCRLTWWRRLSGEVANKVRNIIYTALEVT